MKQSDTIKDIYNEPHFREREEIVEFDHPVIGSIPFTMTPFKPLRTPLNRALAGPVLGADNEAVLKEYLNMDEAAILDFSTLLPGPLATMFMADMGAEVVTVTAPGKPDLMNFYPPYIGGTGLSASAARAS